jgi:hypothetical protein
MEILTPEDLDEKEIPRPEPTGMGSVIGIMLIVLVIIGGGTYYLFTR